MRNPCTIEPCSPTYRNLPFPSTVRTSTDDMGKVKGEFVVGFSAPVVGSIWNAASPAPPSSPTNKNRPFGSLAIVSAPVTTGIGLPGIAVKPAVLRLMTNASTFEVEDCGMYKNLPFTISMSSAPLPVMAGEVNGEITDSDPLPPRPNAPTLVEVGSW